MTEDISKPSDKILCACGRCSELIPAINKRGERARFKHGHNQSGVRHWKWKGGVSMHSNGYRLISVPGHHRANIHGYVPEHTLVMEKMIGRPLQPDEEVHHINQIRTDNRPENLQLITHAEHTRLHFKGKPKTKQKAVL